MKKQYKQIIIIAVIVIIVLILIFDRQGVRDFAYSFVQGFKDGLNHK